MSLLKVEVSRSVFERTVCVCVCVCVVCRSGVFQMSPDVLNTSFPPTFILTPKLVKHFNEKASDFTQILIIDFRQTLTGGYR